MAAVLLLDAGGCFFLPEVYLHRAGHNTSFHGILDSFPTVRQPDQVALGRSSKILAPDKLFIAFDH